MEKLRVFLGPCLGPQGSGSGFRIALRRFEIPPVGSIDTVLLARSSVAASECAGCWDLGVLADVE